MFYFCNIFTPLCASRSQLGGLPLLGAMLWREHAACAHASNPAAAAAEGGAYFDAFSGIVFYRCLVRVESTYMLHPMISHWLHFLFWSNRVLCDIGYRRRTDNIPAIFRLRHKNIDKHITGFCMTFPIKNTRVQCFKNSYLSLHFDF